MPQNETKYFKGGLSQYPIILPYIFYILYKFPNSIYTNFPLSLPL